LSDKVIKKYKISIGTPFKMESKKSEIEYSENKDTDDSIQSKINESQYQYNMNMEADEEKQNNGYGINGETLLLKAQNEANTIIEEAENEAGRILKKAYEEADKITNSIEEAKLNGYNDGYNEAKIKYMSLISEAVSIKEDASKKYAQILEDMESDIVEIILNIAKKVLTTEISQNKEVIFNLVKEAIDACKSKNKVLLKLSPNDYDYVISDSKKIDSMIDAKRIESFEVIKDSTLEDGDCIAETPYGNVDTSVRVKLEKIEKIFKELINLKNEEVSSDRFSLNSLYKEGNKTGQN